MIPDSEIARKIPDSEIARKQLYDSGLNDREIGDMLDVTRFTIRYWRTRRGLPPNFSFFLPSQAERFFELYKKGYNDNEIAKVLGIDQSRVSEFREHKDLPPAVLTEVGQRRLEDRVQSGEITPNQAEEITKTVDSRNSTIATREAKHLRRDVEERARDAWCKNNDPETVFTAEFLKKYFGIPFPGIKRAERKYR